MLLLLLVHFECALHPNLSCANACDLLKDLISPYLRRVLCLADICRVCPLYHQTKIGPLEKV